MEDSAEVADPRGDRCHAGAGKIEATGSRPRNPQRCAARIALCHGNACLGDRESHLRDSRPQLCRVRRSPLVFVDRSGTGLTRERVWRIVREAKIEGKASPHMLRHSCATHMVGNGADLRTVQTILGHADIATTQVYTHVAMDHLKSVYRAHHPRAKRRISTQKEPA
ncbi:MAG: hypothetical protein DMG64_15735 [Acidobacteria bacterium]|nr:MAG: hypothetical protein DMG64_15735 [Acidobacteriota bacterium]